MARGAFDFGSYNPQQVDQARTQNRLRTMQMRQAENQLDRQNALREAMGSLYTQEPVMQRQVTNRNALMPGPGGQQSGGRAGPSMDQIKRGTDEVQVGTRRQFNPDALDKIMRLDPGTGMKIQQQRASMAEAQREQEDREAVVFANMLDQVEKLPPEQRQAGYERMRQYAANRLGMDVSDMPAEYDPTQAGMVRAWAASTGEYEPAEAGEAPKTVGGMQWNPETQQFEPIPGYVEQKERVARAGAPTTKLNMGERETAYEKARGGQAAERYNEIQKKARQANDDMRAMRGIERMLNDFETGQLAGVKMTLNEVARDLGIPEDYRQYVPGGLSDRELAAGETIRNLSSGLVFGALQNFSGAISEGERAFVERVTPGLTTTPQGIRQIKRIRDRIAERAETKARLADQWEGEYGGLHKRDEKNRSFQSMWQDYINNNPLISEDNREAISDLSDKSAPDTRLVDPDQVKTIDGQRYIKIGDAWYEG